jgi:hypothetical protein
VTESAGKSIINKLQTSIPRGGPFDTHTLKGLGISPGLAHHYISAGWLTRLGRGVFMFAGDTLGRDPTLKFLSTRIKGLHVSGKTALDWQGFRQNLSHRETICLSGDEKAVLPAWFLARFSARYSARSFFTPSLPEGFGLAALPEAPDGPLVSVPERALLEMLGKVGTQQEVTEARSIMEMMHSLRAEELTVLLKNCRMIKVARLCVLWAEEFRLPWAGRAREAANLGTGRWVKRLKNGSTLILKA